MLALKFVRRTKTHQLFYMDRSRQSDNHMISWRNCPSAFFGLVIIILGTKFDKFFPIIKYIIVIIIAIDSPIFSSLAIETFFTVFSLLHLVTVLFDIKKRKPIPITMTIYFSFVSGLSIKHFPIEIDYFISRIPVHHWLLSNDQFSSTSVFALSRICDSFAMSHDL